MIFFILKSLNFFIIFENFPKIKGEFCLLSGVSPSPSSSEHDGHSPMATQEPFREDLPHA